MIIIMLAPRLDYLPVVVAMPKAPRLAIACRPRCEDSRRKGWNCCRWQTQDSPCTSFIKGHGVTCLTLRARIASPFYRIVFGHRL
jgi:hypothetical protein